MLKVQFIQEPPLLQRITDFLKSSKTFPLQIFLSISISFVQYSDLIQNGDEPEQQAVSAHQLPDARHPAGLAHLHRPVQGVRQAHEPHPLRLRGVQASLNQG